MSKGSSSIAVVVGAIVALSSLSACNFGSDGWARSSSSQSGPTPLSMCGAPSFVDHGVYVGAAPIGVVWYDANDDGSASYYAGDEDDQVTDDGSGYSEPPPPPPDTSDTSSSPPPSDPPPPPPTDDGSSGSTDDGSSGGEDDGSGDSGDSWPETYASHQCVPCTVVCETDDPLIPSRAAQGSSWTYHAACSTAVAHIELSAHTSGHRVTQCYQLTP